MLQLALPVLQMGEQRREEAISRTFHGFQNFCCLQHADYVMEQNQFASQPRAWGDRRSPGQGQHGWADRSRDPPSSASAYAGGCQPDSFALPSGEVQAGGRRHPRPKDSTWEVTELPSCSEGNGWNVPERRGASTWLSQHREAKSLKSDFQVHTAPKLWGLGGSFSCPLRPPEAGKGVTTGLAPKDNGDN